MSFKRWFLIGIPVVIFNTGFALKTANFKMQTEQEIQKIETHDEEYIRQKGPNFFKWLSQGQKPLFTLITCSDSRVQANIFDNNPEGEFFTIRNIGNQLSPNLGSVDYGISHLNTRILLIIGHSECGAIDAIRNGDIHHHNDIAKELKTIHINQHASNMSGVQENVHNQVAIALQKYSAKVKSQQLTIVGAVYDFADALHTGAGKLLIINVNGETSKTQIKKMMSKGHR